MNLRRRRITIQKEGTLTRAKGNSPSNGEQSPTGEGGCKKRAGCDTGNTNYDPDNPPAGSEPDPADGGFTDTPTDDLPPDMHPENGPPNTPIDGVPEPPAPEGRPPDSDPGTPIDPNFDPPTPPDTGTPEDPGSSDPGQGSKKRPHDGSGPDGGGKKGCVKRDGCGDGTPSGEADIPGSTGEASGETNVPGNNGSGPGNSNGSASPGNSGSGAPGNVPQVPASNVPSVSPGTATPNEGPAVSPATPQSPMATCCDSCTDSPPCDITWSGMFLSL
jgi:hypothetical protein